MRRFIALMSVFIIVIAMSFPVKAANESFMRVIPSLSISGTTATCSLNVYAEHTTDLIKASVVLKHGNSVVAQWLNMTANGYMFFSDTVTVAHGETYTMQVTLEINGVSYPIADIAKTCP
ncbi:MAG: hypothetical protein IKO41_17260 [Lachnospiraceae bacterium]|nr:hypothetical protein [Lachnospiraceae bacterium]